jgi:uncharacterized protein
MEKTDVRRKTFPFFQVMVKPTGPICNLHCTYCYYLSKKDFFKKQESFRICEELIEKFIKQDIAAQGTSVVIFSWQGGEPILMGLDFFRKVIEFQKKYCPPDKQISNDLQTNGTLLDDQWCEFLRDNKFLVGLSIDGPRELHDYYRMDKKQNSTFESVIAGAELMKKHNVEFNTLTVVNRMNGQKPLEVYKFLRDELGSQYQQYIACVEPKDFAQVAPQYWDQQKQPGIDTTAARPGQPDSVVTDWTVDPDDYGNFMCAIFDEWLRHDVGKIFVPMFDTALGLWMGLGSSSCNFAEVCGTALAMEHDGSLYSCDHYVYPEYRLGNIATDSLTEMVYGDRQVKFGHDKTDTLPEYCRKCDVRFACNGECPKNRFILAPDGEPGLNYLCRGLHKYLKHIGPWMKLMARELRAGRTADNVMKIANKDVSRPSAEKGIKLNAPCPCGSGRKYKKCCGASQIA